MNEYNLKNNTMNKQKQRNTNTDEVYLMFVMYQLPQIVRLVVPFQKFIPASTNNLF